ncbi:MAG TPA: hypothetical protein VKA44_07310, partial [Gemmatimonadota bacterium]|nr:hypothetical protein [Gemmatimonadota bacterium]
LAAIAIPQYASTKGKAFDAAAKSDLRNLMTAEEAYYFANNTYTASTATLQTNNGFELSAGVTATIQTGSGFYKADASHASSAACFRVAYGTGQVGTIERVAGSSAGSGDCGG